VKILYICADSGVPALGRKGASVHVREMIEALRRAGHSVVLAAQTLQKSTWEEPAALSAPVIHVKPSADTLAITRAIKEFNSKLEQENSLASDIRRIAYNRDLEAELLRRFDSDPPDLIYERASLLGIAGGSVARAFRKPLIIELNAPLATEQSAYRETLLPKVAVEAERAALSRADAVFVVSETLRAHVHDLGIPSEKIHVVPNGVDARRFHPAPRDEQLRERLGFNGAQVLGFVGGLRPWHGVERLPELLQVLAPAFPNLKLVFVGSGQLERDLKLKFAEKNLSGRVLFLGATAHDEVPAIIRQFDIALAPYPEHAHSFYFSPLKMFEYLACGVATVAADIGQISEIVKHRETGWLYKAGDFAALAEACQTLLKDSALRERLGASGAKLIHEHYTWDHNARRVEQFMAERKPAAS
jgi:glycosyltransferase involved in cell wall biosynthesis